MSAPPARGRGRGRGAGTRATSTAPRAGGSAANAGVAPNLSSSGPSAAQPQGGERTPVATDGPAPGDTASLTGRAPPASRTRTDPGAVAVTASQAPAGTRSGAGGPVTAGGGPSNTGRRVMSATPTPAPAGAGGTRSSATPAPSGSGATTSMVPSKSSYSARGQTRMMFRPVMPQRRKPTEIEVKQEPGTSEGGGFGRGRGRGEFRGRGRGRGRGGAAPAPVEMTASGPFAMGPAAAGSSGGRRRSAISVGPASGAFGGRFGGGLGGESNNGLKPDPARSAYRDPDKLADKEQYSDPEDEGIEIVDMDEVHELDELAPRALPRLAEKEEKKSAKAKKKQRERKDAKTAAKQLKEEEKGDAMLVDGVKVKPEPEDEERASAALSASATPQPEGREDKGKARATTISSGTGTPALDGDDDDEDEKEEVVKNADALDLSESEDEEFMDDLVDDFVENGEEETSPENQLYLFQFPRLFPKFKYPPSDDKEAVKPEAEASASGSEGSPGKPRRSVAFAPDTAGGGGATGSQSGLNAEASPTGAAKVKKDPDATGKEEAQTREGPEGQIGQLKVYRDGRVNFHFGDVVMEVAGGSQSTFLQQVMVLDTSTKRAVSLGELHRKFIVTPELGSMLDDFEQASIADAEAEKRAKQEGGEPVAGVKMR